ncbi:hypothetical protein AO262_28310 [Pseudomonas fluorescens ABAC62]|nr:hypothetical protein AO262_28310 [Pseudomonas fluorescens ABAC62]
MQEALQRRQQALLIMKRQALLPQGVELIQHIQLGNICVDAIEHLHAIGDAHGQQQRQVMVFQGHGVQVQRAVAGQLLAEVSN